MSKHQRFLNINFFQLLSSDLGPMDRISWISCSDALACKASKVCCHKSARPGWRQRRELQKRTWHRLRMLRISHNANLYSLYLFILFLYLVSLWDRLWFMFFTHFKINQSRQSLSHPEFPGACFATSYLPCVDSRQWGPGQENPALQ